MDIKLTALTILSITIFVIGFILETSTGGLNLQIIPPGTSALILSILTIGFGLLFFGYFPWVMTFLIGNYLGLAFKLQEQTLLQITLTSLSVFLMAFASISLGMTLYNDITGKGNFIEGLKKNVIIIVIALVLAIIPGFL